MTAPDTPPPALASPHAAPAPPNLWRWIGVLPAALAGWLLGLATGLFLYGRLASLCPADQMVSGLCGASWYPLASQAVVCFGAALAAFLVVLLPSLVAPSHRITVAWVAFVSGAILAAVLAWLAASPAELASALAAGLLAVWAVRKFVSTRPPGGRA